MPVLRACFIGIDRYQESTVRDLTGAVRDARALYALFRDSIPQLQTTLLTDEQATYATVSQTLRDLLLGSGPDDTVIFSFAGHGSPSHRLLTCDTLRSEFVKTTISMDHLAQLFRDSPAKYILCLLDCCFSGAAGARVFDEAPLLRDTGDPYAGFQGKGRMLLAAARADQPAIEDPLTRHGLFTKAFLDIVQTQEEGADLGAIAGLVMDRVRADAQRQGYDQTPIASNLVDGGLKLPRLRPGAAYRQAFPDVCGTRIAADTAELRAFGLPELLVNTWKSNYPELNTLQIKAINDYRILDGESLLVVAPTSSGKTFIGELAAARAIVEGRKAVFLLPYRALVGEKFDQFAALYGETLGMRVIRCCGDRTDDNGRFLHGKYDLAVLTYEMFLGLAISNPALLAQIGLVVLDEAQFITDPTRGISVELLLTLVISGRARAVCPQLLALSAVIGNINHFDAWLGCKALVTTDRPIKLTEGVIDRSGVYQYLCDDGTTKTIQFLAPGAVQQRRNKPSAQDLIVPLARKLLNDGKTAIIFRNKKGSAEGCAKYLAHDLSLPEAADVLKQLPAVDLSTSSASLREALSGGTAFHTANLNRDERAIVERAFRDPRSGVHFLAATTTVAAGINTPASVVIIAEQEFKGENGRPFTVAEYKNMAGRAGRLGFQEEGMAIIYAETPLQREQLFHRYVRGCVEQLTSSFNESELHTWVIRLLSQVRELPRQEIISLLSSTYGGYLLNRNRPDWAPAMRLTIEQVVQEMIQYGLLDEEFGYVSLTPLGRACGNSSLSYRSALRLIEMLKSFTADSMTPDRLMALLQGLSEMDAVSTPLSKGAAEQTFMAQTSGYFGNEVALRLQHHCRDASDYPRRCKRACVLAIWLEGAAYDVIEQRFTVNPFFPIGAGDIRAFVDTTRYHLRSAAQILRLIYLEAGPGDKELETFLKRLEVGIPVSAAGLLDLPLTMLRGEYLALCQAGVCDVDAVQAAPRENVERLLGPERTEELLFALQPGDSR